jgi:hypothetical protein
VDSPARGRGSPRSRASTLPLARSG